MFYENLRKSLTKVKTPALLSLLISTFSMDDFTSQDIMFPCLSASTVSLLHDWKGRKGHFASERNSHMWRWGVFTFLTGVGLMGHQWHQWRPLPVFSLSGPANVFWGLNMQNKKNAKCIHYYRCFTPIPASLLVKTGPINWQAMRLQDG